MNGQDAERASHNGWLVLAGRISMAVTGPALIGVFMFVWAQYLALLGLRDEVRDLNAARRFETIPRIERLEQDMDRYHPKGPRSKRRGE